MSTHQCHACKSATLVDSQTIHRVVMVAGLLDNALRKYRQLIQTEPYQGQAWSDLHTLLKVLPTTDRQRDDESQSAILAKNIKKNWLGDFDSLCLTCGFMFLSQ